MYETRLRQTIKIAQSHKANKKGQQTPTNWQKNPQTSDTSGILWANKKYVFRIETSQLAGLSMDIYLWMLSWLFVSMDWFKGNLTGKPHIQWENLWFPVDFPVFFPLKTHGAMGPLGGSGGRRGSNACNFGAAWPAAVGGRRGGQWCQRWSK